MRLNTCRFQGVLQIRGINPFVRVSAARVEALKPGWRKPLPVLLKINGKPVNSARTNMMPAGDGSFFLYLNEIVRSAAGVGVGDRVRVEISFDAEYRYGPQHPMPAWFGKALKENPQAKKNWGLLIPSRKKEVLRYLAQLKSEGARKRNLAKVMDALTGKEVRFMARTWRHGA